jgi:C_GCAxxG_C_C family probable redox protein
VLLAVCQQYGIETDDRIIPRIATGLAGGFGNTGTVCGAVVGAVMGLGLMTDRGDSMEEVLGALGTVGELRRRFEDEMGSIHCRELTGADLTTPEGVAEYMGSDTPQKVCFPAVSTAYRLVLELVDERA